MPSSTLPRERRLGERGSVLRRGLVAGGVETFVSGEGEEVWLVRAKARRVLQAATVEAYGRPGVYVRRDPIMRRANISDVKEFLAIAQHVERRGWIAEADADYTIFVVTSEGIDEAQR